MTRPSAAAFPVRPTARRAALLPAFLLFAAAPEMALDATFATVVSDPSSRPLLLWMGIGKDDSLLKRNVAFHEWLGQKGIAHTWVVSDGGHEWPNWRAYLPQFLERIFR